MKYLRELPNTQFISLQKGKYNYQKVDLKELEFVDGQKEFDDTLDFKVTSAVLANCDYVISSDSSIVHLAGSMNIKKLLRL